MIKKIIFDIDNTLIVWKDEYIDALIYTMKEFNVQKSPEEIDNVIELQEKNHDIISKETLLNDINSKCNLNLKINFIDKLFERQKLLADIDCEVIDTLEYLRKKYKLVALTNYFKEVQVERLKKVNIYKYFEHVYAGDEVKVKPNKESFYKAMGSNNNDECIVIGDDLQIDIEGALNANIKSILLDSKNKFESSNRYIKIQNIRELMEIL